MWYDKYQGLPPRNSPLETLFCLIYLQRQEQQLHATRALIQSTLPEGQEQAKPAVEAFRKYYDLMMPFIETAKDVQKNSAREQLFAFAKHPMKIDLLHVYADKSRTATAKATRKAMKLKRGTR